MQILIIEDERVLRDSIAEYFKTNGYICTTVGTLKKGLEKSSNYIYDCVLIDIGLPDGSGMDIIGSFKKNNPNTGIIIISAKNSLEDKVNGLHFGADDYLTKPFHLSELYARVHSIIRRRSFNGQNQLIFEDIVVNLDKKQVVVHNKEIKLTRKEYDILIYLAANPTHLVTKEAIADAIWGYRAEMATSFDFVYGQIKNLKRKLSEAGAKEYVKVVYGMGYKFY
jgi:DNA-binding response OmpR family regulator